MPTYYKEYTREVCLIAIEIWETQQRKLYEDVLDDCSSVGLVYEAHDGVVSVYYPTGMFDDWREAILKKASQNTDYITLAMVRFEQELNVLEQSWKQKHLQTPSELKLFFNNCALTWLDMGIAYFAPEVEQLPEKSKQLGMDLRIKAADFLEETNHVIGSTLKSWFPYLNDLYKYLTLGEAVSGNIPNKDVLTAREQYYVYYNFKLHTNITLEEVASFAGVQIQRLALPVGTTEITGQTASTGKVRGRVRILVKKSQIPDLLDGEVLVTAMTTPDFLPAMRKAAAFVTDEGGITCHAAIVAREFGKPCVIGTKFATQVLHDGDFVEVDADNSVGRVLKRI